MARFCPLFSGSSGNSIYIGNNDGGILVDTGMSAKKIGEALFNIGVAPESLNAVFVTHEHSDHIKGLRVFASKYHIKVYGTNGTLSALDDMGILNGKFETEEVSFSGNEAGPLFVTPFHTSHDAREKLRIQNRLQRWQKNLHSHRPRRNDRRGFFGSKRLRPCYA